MLESTGSYRSNSKRKRRHVLTTVVSQMWDDALSFWKDWTENQAVSHDQSVIVPESNHTTSNSERNEELDLEHPNFPSESKTFPRPILLDNRKLSASSTSTDAPLSMESMEVEGGRRASLQRMKKVSWTDRNLNGL
jgi:hypothetical protein